MEVKTTYPNGTVTGTTTASYVDKLTIYDAKGCVIQITNSDSSSTMYYKITGYRSAHSSCVATVIQAETSIAAATTIELPDSITATKLNTPFAKIVVSVVNNSGECAFVIDWISY